MFFCVISELFFFLSGSKDKDKKEKDRDKSSKKSSHRSSDRKSPDSHDKGREKSKSKEKDRRRSSYEKGSEDNHSPPSRRRSSRWERDERDRKKDRSSSKDSKKSSTSSSKFKSFEPLSYPSSGSGGGRDNKVGVPFYDRRSRSRSPPLSVKKFVPTGIGSVSITKGGFRPAFSQMSPPIGLRPGLQQFKRSPSPRDASYFGHMTSRWQ